MERELVDTLRRLNNSFYECQAAAFSATRQNPWSGWSHVIDVLQGNPPRKVADVGCGNMRFKTFLEDGFGADSFDYCGIDSCATLAELGSGRFLRLDIVESLLDDSLHASLQEIEPDLSVAFGVMHHIPSRELRARFVESLVRSSVPGGTVVLSFWQFAEDRRMRAKAERTTEKGLQAFGFELEDGDYLLGWADKPDAYRYCHSFSQGEIDDLVSCVAADAPVVDRFAADGRNGAMNGYVVFRRR